MCYVCGDSQLVHLSNPQIETCACGVTQDHDHPFKTVNGKLTFETKDSGQRQEFSTGMVRDIQTNKPRYDLVDWPMIKRWAELMQRGALKYGEHNWKKAATPDELIRFKASALRHVIQWYNEETDEDHGAAVYFNIAGAEMVKEKLKKGEKPLAF